MPRTGGFAQRVRHSEEGTQKRSALGKKHRDAGTDPAPGRRGVTGPASKDDGEQRACWCLGRPFASHAFEGCPVRGGRRGVRLHSYRDALCELLKPKCTQFNHSGLTSSSESATLYEHSNNRDTQCQAGSMSVGQRCLGKRESGARPERSGHCERGERLQGPLCQRHEKAQPIDHPQVRKPAEKSGAQLPKKAGRQRAGNGFVCVCPVSAFLKGRRLFSC